MERTSFIHLEDGGAFPSVFLIIIVKAFRLWLMVIQCCLWRKNIIKQIVIKIVKPVQTEPLNIYQFRL